MNDFFTDLPMKNKGFETGKDSPAVALRHGVFNTLTPILLSSDFINDSAMRDLIKESCSSMVSLIENIIEQYNLDQKVTARD